ncbi:MAG TPA: ATP-binding cassette domain-containing protein [candidate division Zixibacteria bacterium]|nr:ATP-binding cassette domain-containing protein [candidate division Zixibacteria bacterium]
MRARIRRPRAARRVPALELRGVSYRVAGRRILDSIDWTVLPGEHWAILGPNGSGKTTLLKVAFGYLWPNDGGKVLRRGRERVNLPRLRRSVGWVTSTLAAQIPPREKVIRTVISGRFAQIGYIEAFAGPAVAGDYRAARRYLKEIGSDHLSEQEFGTLSQGEQQKVLIARARMTRPYLIILDEPCAGMDPGAREAFLASLQKLAREKRFPSLLYVTHHVEEILPLFRKTLVLKDGMVLYAGPTPDALTPAVLERIYGVSLRVIRAGGRYWPIVG